MRFEVPFNLEVDVICNSQVALSAALDALEKFSPDDLICKRPSPNPFQVFQQEVLSGNNVPRSFESDGYDDLESTRQTLNHFNRELQDVLQDQFSSKLQLQNDQVDTLIAQELERRQIEAERVRRAEEERKRKEEERKRQEQLELERKRKQELEAKRKAEEEKQRAECERKAKEEAEKQRQAEEAKKKAEEAKVKAEKDRQTKLALANQNKSITNYDSIAEKFAKYKQDIKDIKENVKVSMANNPPLTKLVNPYKRKLNAKFGQLSNSLAQWQAVQGVIHEVLEMASQAPDQLVFKWLLNFVAKAIIDQAETEVVTSPNMAVPLGMLAMKLLLSFPQLEYYLTARFVKKCPYILGYNCSIDTENGRYNMGWKRRDQNWEDEVKYEERVSGIASVWAVMTTLAPKDLSSEFWFYSMSNCWSFVARLLNLDSSLLLSTHFSIAANWWEAGAEHFANTYGKQAHKLLITLLTEWPLSVSNQKFAGAARLLIIGEEFMKTGKFEKLKPMEQ